MLKIVVKDGLQSDHPMRINALVLKKLVEGNSVPNPKSLLGAWARARKAYCEYTETPLIDPVVIETGAKLIEFLKGKSK
jgi:hypothetical protein